MDDLSANKTALPPVCINCGNPDIVQNVPNALCVQCRTAAIKFPIPLWVKLFGSGILLLIIFSLINLPQNLTLGLCLERGINAEKQNKFVTAQRYFKQAVRLDSNNIESNAHLLIASYYNDDMQNFFEAADKLGSKTIDNEDLLNKVNILFDRSSYYYPADSFREVEQRYQSADDIPDSSYTNFIKKNKNENSVFEETMYASKLFDNKNYAACDSMVHVILNTDDENMNALALMGSAKRFENQPDSAIYYCNQILELNNEFVYAKCLKARALLKAGKNNEALQLALDCKNTDSADAYTMATLALAYHFNHQPQQRDAVLLRAERIADSSSIPVFQYMHDVINNKESL